MKKFAALKKFDGKTEVLYCGGYADAHKFMNEYAQSTLIPFYSVNVDSLQTTEELSRNFDNVSIALQFDCYMSDVLPVYLAVVTVQD